MRGSFERTSVADMEGEWLDVVGTRCAVSEVATLYCSGRVGRVVLDRRRKENAQLREIAEPTQSFGETSGDACIAAEASAER